MASTDVNRIRVKLNDGAMIDAAGYGLRAGDAVEVEVRPDDWRPGGVVEVTEESGGMLPVARRVSGSTGDYDFSKGSGAE